MLRGNLVYITFFIGIASGIVNGLLGIGGGTIVIPAMVMLLNVEQHKAHGSSLAIILPTAIISTFIYWYNGNVDLLLALKITSAGIIGGYLGAKLLNYIPSTYLRKFFGIFMIVAGVRMVL